MVLNEKTGEVEEDAKEIVWKIKNFFSLSTKVADCYFSSDFHFAGETWCLKICPGGNKETAIGWISLYLVKKHTWTKCSVQYTLDLKKEDGSLLRNDEFTSNIFENNGHGYSKLIQRSELRDRISELVPSNVLTVVCTIRKSSPLPEVTAADMKFSELDTLSKNFEGLVSQEKLCDVTLVVGEKSFQVHKLVLMARSPVFFAMFEHDMSESQTSAVDIPDCDEESFGTFLKYLYSGRVEGVSFGSALHLYRIAHKYDVPALKDICLRILKKWLTVADVIDAVILADQYEEDDLMDSAQHFFKDNFDEIISTKQWESLNSRNFLLANKLNKAVYLMLKKQINNEAGK